MLEEPKIERFRVWKGVADTYYVSHMVCGTREAENLIVLLLEEKLEVIWHTKGSR